MIPIVREPIQIAPIVLLVHVLLQPRDCLFEGGGALLEFVNSTAEPVNCRGKRIWLVEKAKR
jgi:hypothetical protein